MFLVEKKLKLIEFWTKRGLLLKVHKFQKWFMVFCLVWVSCGVLFAAAKVVIDLMQGDNFFSTHCSYRVLGL